MRKTLSPFTRFRAYVRNHLQVLLASLGRLSRQPLAALMTIAVIAIALTLPASLFIAIDNLGQLGDQWDNSSRISLYLKADVSLEQARALRKRLMLNRNIRDIELIDKDTGLAQFKQYSGFKEALDYLDSNPLPIVLVVQPETRLQQASALEALLKTLRRQKQVDQAQLDVEWVRRLLALLDIARRAVWVIGGLLALAVLLIVGNTIRLAIQNRRNEIEVAKLIGASDAFIRRPFLYTGLWYGLLGGLLAWLLTWLGFALMQEPVARLADLYHSQFRLAGPGTDSIFYLISIACLLGLGGSWLTVGRHLKAIEPQ